MAKKSLSKLLSVILTIAICATSIFGCVIAVNAAETAIYTISSEKVEKEDTEATVQLSFNAPQGMASVSFVVDNVGGWYSAVSVGFAGATDTNGTALSESDGFVITAEQIENASDYLVIVEHQASVNDALCANLVLNLTFTFAPLPEKQAITISDIEAYDIYGDEITFTGTVGELNTGCEHVYQVSGTPVYTDDTNGYEVYSIATCTLCGETKDGYQVVPTDSGTATTNEWSLLAANIEYLDSGNFNLNFHFDPPASADAENIYLYVPTSTEAEKGEFQKLSAAANAVYGKSSFANNGLPETAMMFTIKNLSAKDIDILWLPTIVATAEDGSGIVYGATQQLSVEDYATDVVLGKATYVTSTTEEEKQLDKDVAAALINYGYAAKDALAVNSITAEEAGTTDTWDYVTSSTGTLTLYDDQFIVDNEGDGTANKPYIIRTAEQLASVCAARIKDADGTTVGTAGLYFKVADGITAFYMNGGETVANLTSAAAVKDWFEDTANKKSQWWANGKFQGNFDGNGITIYGLYCTQANAGLFHQVDGITIKNTTIKNSYFAARNNDGTAASGDVGAFIGNVGWVNGDVYGDITLEQIASINNYIESSSNSGQNGPGAIAGNLRTAKYNINNCLAVGNEMGNKTSSTYTGIVAYGGNKNFNAELGSVQNVIAIGVAPYTKGGGWHCHAADTGVFKNIYTTADVTVMGSYSATVATNYNLNTLTSAQMTGTAAMTNMPALDWENTWIYGAPGEYPSLAKPTSTTVEKTDIDTSWDGYDDDFIVHEDQEGNGTSESPYIIYDAEDLASVCAARVVSTLGESASTGSTPIDTTGVYFKVADNIKAFYMNGGETVANLNSSAEVYKYFVTDGNAGKLWYLNKTFNGHFDGNGATVYGLYATREYAGLFQQVGTAATIKDVTVANSYICASSYYSGGLVGHTSTSGGTLTIENCAVINSYIHSSYSNETYAYYGGAGALVGNNYWGPTITINNCLVYGNDIGNDYAGTLTTPGLVGFAAKGTVSNTIAIGVNPYIIADASNGQFNSLKASAKAENFTNVYTDMDITVAETLYGIDYTDSQIKQLTTAQMQGKAAAENMDLAWDDVWFTGAIGEYPAFTKQGILPSSLQAQYDALVLDNYDEYGETDPLFSMYASSLNLKTNPYIAFTFAFGGDYKTNRDKITVNFYKEDETLITKTTVGNGSGGVSDGWTNAATAGRYHLYRLEGISVEDMCKGIEVTVSYNNQTYTFGTFSVEGFALEAYRANRILPCEYYATRYEAAKALLFYTQMVNERYGA